MNRAALVAEAEAIRARLSDININEVPADQVEAVTADIARAEELDAEVDKLDALAERAKAVTSRVASGEIKQERAAAPTTFVRSTDADLYDLNSVNRSNPQAATADLVARALTAVERNAERAFTDEQREAVTAKIELAGRSQDKMAEYVLMTGSPEYAREFERFIGSQGRSFGPQLERAAMSLTTANGGAMVPYILDPSIMLTNNGQVNPMRRVSRVETIVGANEWRGVTSAGVSAEWLAEGTEAADASPTFTQPAIPTYKASAYLFGSYEVLADSGFASQVQPLIMDAKDRIEGTAFTTGSGSGQPQGWVTGKVAAGSLVASASTDTFALADVYNTEVGLADRWADRATWQCNRAIANRIRQFDTAGGAGLWAQLGAGTPPALLGSGYNPNSNMDGSITALADNYVLGYGDWYEAYIIVDRVGVEVYYDNLVLGANQRPTGQAGFFAFWRTGGEVVVPAAISLLNVT